MFIIQLIYKVPLETVDQHLKDHREFLDSGYQQNYFIASGPKNPRTGGIILSQIKDHAKLNAFLQMDPFFIHNIADYEITEFTPVKFHTDFERFL